MGKALAGIKKICSTCRTGSYEDAGCRFQGISLPKRQTLMARYGLVREVEIVAKNMVTVIDGALDGQEWQFNEIVGGKVQSRANGGRSKGECGLIPQVMALKSKNKTLQTELLHIDREECTLQLIGSVFQRSADNDSGLAYINANSTLEQVASNTDIFLQLAEYDYSALAHAISGTAVLGDFVSGQSGCIGKFDEPDHSLSVYPHFDGFLKQASQQAGAAVSAVVTIELPEVKEPDCFFIEWCGQISNSAATADELVDTLNSLCLNINGVKPYTAALDGTTLTIVANQLEDNVYGAGDLLIYVAEEVCDCQEALPYTQVQAPMVYAEQPLNFKYSEIDCESIYDYFKDNLKVIMKKCVSNSTNGLPTDMGYFAVDPLLLIDFQFGEFEEMCRCDGGLDRLNAIKSLMPRVEGLEVLKGTGLWFWTTQDNAYLITNTTDRRLANTTIGYDPKCRTVYARNEVLANVLIADFGKFASNVCGSPFESKLHAPYLPENLPHCVPANRPSACPVDEPTTCQANACVVLIPAEEEGGDCTLSLKDDSTIPAGDSIASVNWSVWVDNAEHVADATGDVDLVIPGAVCPEIVYVKYTVTLASGDVKEVYITRPNFVID